MAKNINEKETSKMKKVWDKIVEVLAVIWKGIKTVFTWFFKIFNTKEKLAAIAVALYTWQTLPSSLQDKLQICALFFILGVLLLNIKEGK